MIRDGSEDAAYDCRSWSVVVNAWNVGDAAKIAVEVPIDRGEPHYDDPSYDARIARTEQAGPP